jgi:hypothetical protein
MGYMGYRVRGFCWVQKRVRVRARSRFGKGLDKGAERVKRRVRAALGVVV